MVESLLIILKDYGGQISAIGAAIAFIFGIYKYFSERRESHFWKEFDVYHKLVKELVEPPAENGALYLDRQTAIMFELRFFSRYHAHSLRMLMGLRTIWAAVPSKFPRLIEEMDLTIKLLEEKTKPSRVRKWFTCACDATHKFLRG